MAAMIRTSVANAFYFQRGGAFGVGPPGPARRVLALSADGRDFSDASPRELA
jgi:hypothetical protein